MEHDQLVAPAHRHVLHRVVELPVQPPGSGQPGTSVARRQRGARSKRRPGFERGAGSIGPARADLGTRNPATAVAGAVTGDERRISACPAATTPAPATPALADPVTADPVTADPEGATRAA